MEYRFRRIEAEDFNRIDSLRRRYGSVMTATSPQALYTWQDKMQLQIAFGREAYFVKKESGYFYPVGEEQEKKKFLSDILQNTGQTENGPSLVYLTAEEVCELRQWFPETFSFSYREEDAEYVYEREALLEHRGKAYANFRRKWNKIMASYSLRVREIGKEDVEFLKQITLAWGKDKGSEEFGDTGPVLAALDVYELFQYRGILLEESGREAAFIFGYENQPDMFTLSMVKTLPELGSDMNTACIYYMLGTLEGYPFVNMEEDCGIAGLRRMKRLMNPAYMLGAYQAYRK